MLAYCTLADQAVVSGELLWPSRPKHHVASPYFFRMFECPL